MTDDPRYIVVDGRRWRATDPRIPERLRVELVGESAMADARRVARRLREEGLVPTTQKGAEVDPLRRSWAAAYRPWSGLGGLAISPAPVLPTRSQARAAGP